MTKQEFITILKRVQTIITLKKEFGVTMVNEAVAVLDAARTVDTTEFTFMQECQVVHLRNRASAFIARPLGIALGVQFNEALNATLRSLTND